MLFIAGNTFNFVCIINKNHLWRISNHPILCHPLLLPPSIFPSIRVFPKELALCSPLNVKPHKFQRYKEQVCGAACVTVECELGHVVIGGCPQGGNVGAGIKSQGEGPEGQHVRGPCGSREHSPLEELTEPEGEGGGGDDGG